MNDLVIVFEMPISVVGETVDSEISFVGNSFMNPGGEAAPAPTGTMQAPEITDSVNPLNRTITLHYTFGGTDVLNFATTQLTFRITYSFDIPE